MIAEALAAELTRVREKEHALHIRAAHLQSALTLVRLGQDEGVVRALLASKGIMVGVDTAPLEITGQPGSASMRYERKA